MDKTSICRAGLVLLLVACLLIAGCSGPDTTNVQPVPTTSAGPLYTAGDIVRNATGSTSPAWLVISYDSVSDSYTRALIYQNTDGSYGYRINSKTDTSQRTTMETVYTVKITHVTVSSVMTEAPTIITTEQTTSTTLPETTVTTTAPRAPVVASIIPDVGYAGTNVSVQNLAGENFVVGAKATLSRNGITIPATDVRYISNKSLICTFVIPSNADAGSWDVTVTNPDGHSGTFTNIFTVHRDTSAVATTSSTFSGSVPVTSVDPSFAYSHDYRQFIITGSKFQAGAGVTLQMEGKTDIVGSTVSVISDTRIQCFFDIPYGSTGTWDIVVTNPDQTYGKLIDGFEVRQ